MTVEAQIRYGLADVVVDRTAVSKVMPETNSLTYRGYAVQDLAEKCRFEDVAHLLLRGELPTPEERAAFEREERSLRALDERTLAAIRLFPSGAHPMDTIRTAVSTMALSDPEVADISAEADARKAMRLLARIPTAIAADFRCRKGQELIAPRDDLSIAENFIHMCFGEVPEPDVVRCFDISLILYAEHSFNASTFTARVITSSMSDMYSAVTGAIGSLKGPLHGGANEAVMHMMLEIDDPARARGWMEEALAEKRLVMGFGHRVYKHGDSRVPTMREAFEKMVRLKGGEAGKWLAICEILEEVMVREKGIHPNLDFPTGPAYYLMGFDIPLFTPIFVMSRITGWCAHVMEQTADNKLVRPLSAYVGPEQRTVPRPTVWEGRA